MRSIVWESVSQGYAAKIYKDCINSDLLTSNRGKHKGIKECGAVLDWVVNAPAIAIIRADDRGCRVLCVQGRCPGILIRGIQTIFVNLFLF